MSMLQIEKIRNGLLLALNKEIDNYNTPISLGKFLTNSLNFQYKEFSKGFWRDIEMSKPPKHVKFDKLLYLRVLNSEVDPILVNTFVVYYDKSGLAFNIHAFDGLGQAFFDELVFKTFKDTANFEIKSGKCDRCDCIGYEDVAYMVWLDSKFQYIDCKVAAPFPNSRTKLILTGGFSEEDLKQLGY
jgi:hypothetical protein